MAESIVELRQCKRCGDVKLLTNKYFPATKYKGELKFYDQPCGICLNRERSDLHRSNQQECREKHRVWYRTSQYRDRLLAEAKARRDATGSETQLEKSLRTCRDVLAAGQLTCSKCGEVKPLSKYRRHKRQHGVPYFDKRCLECVVKCAYEWKQRNLEECNRKAREYDRANIEKKRANRRRHGWLHSRNRRKRVKSATFVLITKAQIDELLLKQRNRCAICKKILEKYHLDHIKPLARGGAHQISNLQATHPRCNHKKNAQDPIDFMQKLGFLL